MKAFKSIFLVLGALLMVLATTEAQQVGAADTAVTAQDYARKSGWTPDRQLLGDQYAAGSDDIHESSQTEDFGAPLANRKLLGNGTPSKSAPRKMLTGPKSAQPNKPAAPARSNSYPTKQNPKPAAARPQAAAASQQKRGAGATGAVAAAATVPKRSAAGPKLPVQNTKKHSKAALSRNTVKSSIPRAAPTQQHPKQAAAAAKPVTVTVNPSKPVVVNTPVKTAAVTTAALPVAVPTSTPQRPAAAADTAAATAAVPAVAPVPTAVAAGSGAGKKPLLERRGYYGGRRGYGGYGYGGYSGRSWGGHTYSMAGNSWMSYKATCAHGEYAHACSFTR